MKCSEKTMIRISLYIPQVTDARLRAISAETGTPVSEIVRRAIAAYMLAQRPAKQGNDL